MAARGRGQPHGSSRGLMGPPPAPHRQTSESTLQQDESMPEQEEFQSDRGAGLPDHPDLDLPEDGYAGRSSPETSPQPSEYLPSQMTRFSSQPLPPAAFKRSVKAVAKERKQLAPPATTRQKHGLADHDNVTGGRFRTPGSQLHSESTYVEPSPRRFRPLPRVDYNLNLQSDMDEMYEVDIDRSVLDPPLELFRLNPEQLRQVMMKQYDVSAEELDAWDVEDATLYHEPGDDVDEELDIANDIDETEDVCDPRDAALDVSELRRISARDADMGRMLDALCQGFHQAADVLIEYETATIKFPEIQLRQILQAVYHLLIATDDNILMSHIRGDLTRQYIKHPPTRKALDKLRKRARNTSQPAIYRQALVDVNGDSPTPNQLLEVIGVIQDHYLRHDVQDIDIASKIDSFRAPAVSLQDTARGMRKYLTKGSRGDTKPTAGRHKLLKDFCHQLKRRIKTIPDGDEPMAAPLVEIGYSARVFKRLDDHRLHRSSNYLMNLFEATCDLLFPGQFSIEQHIIYLIFDRLHAVLAEVVFTRLGQGYINNAGGFSFYPAGRSNHSANIISDDKYREWRDWARKHTPMHANHEADHRAQQARKPSQQTTQQTASPRTSVLPSSPPVSRTREQSLEDSLDPDKVRDSIEDRLDQQRIHANAKKVPFRRDGAGGLKPASGIMAVLKKRGLE